MYPEMSSQVTLVDEAAVALITGKVTVIKVFVEVALQVHLLLKRLAAARDGALVGLVARVDP